MTCDRSCRDLSPPDKHGRRQPTGTRSYPLARVCCATAYLLTLPTQRHVAFALSVIEAQVGADQRQAVEKALACARAARPASGSAPRRPGPG